VVLRKGGDLAHGETFYSQKGPGNCTRPLPLASGAEILAVRTVLGGLQVTYAFKLPRRQLWSVSVGKGVAVLSVSYDSCRRPEEPRRYCCVPRFIARQRARVVPRQRYVGAAGGLERHVIHPCPGSSRSSQLPLWVKPGRAGAARAKRGKRELLLAAPVLWLFPSHTTGRVALSHL